MNKLLEVKNLTTNFHIGVGCVQAVRNISFHVNEGESLMEAMHRAGEQLNAPCGGMGTCGKCRIRVTGKVRSVGSGEAFRLEDEEILACRYIPAGKCRIYVPEEQK